MENKFKHSLESKSIVLRQDDDESTFIETNGGVYTPLIRIRETVLPSTSLQSFNLEIGQSLLPRLSVSINDDDFHFRETDFVEGIDLLTIFVGSPNDEINEPIKNDYLIKTVDASAGSSFVSFECELYVPELFNGSNRVVDDTSIAVLEQVAKDCKLGFTTNISSTSDSMKWIQYQNNIDFIHEVTMHSYIDDDASVRVFIDQFANLTVVDLNTVLSSTSSYTLEIDPVTGDELEEPIDLVLTMNKLDNENPAKIATYTPTNKYGNAAKKLATQQNYTTIDYNDYATVETTDGSVRKEQLRATSMFTSVTSENIHEKFTIAPALHENNLQVLQGVQMRLNLDWSVQSLFMMQVVPVDIYNIAKRTYQKSTDESENLDDLTDSEPDAESNAHIKNELLSGNCLILQMSYTYFSVAEASERPKLSQRLKVFKV